MTATAERMAGGLRRFPRTAYTGAVYLMDPDGDGFVLEATDLSRGGVFLRSDVLLEEGEPCLVRFALDDGRRVNAKGRVTRAHTTPSDRCPAGFAIAFDRLDDVSRRALNSVTRPGRSCGSA